MNKKRLGRGLSALLPLAGETLGVQAGVMEIDMDKIRRNPRQPRQAFSQDKLEELAESIRVHGLLQPVILQRDESGGFVLVAGERRFRAAGLAGLKKIPAVIKELAPAEALEIALIENLQREDLNPIEEALAFRQLMEEFSFTQEELAKKLAKSRPAIANALRLLQLPEEVLELVREGALARGHARALLSLGDKEKIIKAAREIAAKGLTVRDAEVMSGGGGAKREQQKKNINPKPALEANDLFITDMEDRLRHVLGCHVRIKRNQGSSSGRVEISFYDEEELERIAEIITAAQN